MIGQNYQVQFRTNLLQTNWVNLGGPILATNTIMSASDAAGAPPQRFYHIVLLP